VQSVDLRRHLVRSVAGAYAVMAAEFVLVAGASRGRLSSVWETQTGLFWLGPTLVVGGAVGGVAGGLILLLLERSQERSHRSVVALVTALFGGIVAWGVGTGRHLQGLPARGGFALAVAGVLGCAAFWIAPRVARALRETPVRAAAASAALVVGLELTNRFVLVRLYPAFHLGLALATLLLGAALPYASAPGEPRRRARWVPAAALAALAAACAVVARPAAARLAYFDTFRLLLTESAPVLGQAVAAAAVLAPPAPLPADGDVEPAPRAAARSVDLRGLDVLLITMDAVRADHVSAYGYGRKTTPAFDQLAREGALFEHAYCPTPHTSYSVTSMMTGKYLRPLLLQGAGEDSDTWAGLLRTYGYRTAAFYPPAVFFIDTDRFRHFRDDRLDFEYAKVEFLEGDARVRQVAGYLAAEPPDRRLFLWVHLFGPHEPYEDHPGFSFGERDVDRYDSEIAAADAATGQLVAAFRKRRPSSVVIISSDHGEEFGEHGGRYHGTAVYEEQVRVPLASHRGVPAVRRRAGPGRDAGRRPAAGDALCRATGRAAQARCVARSVRGARAPGRGQAVARGHPAWRGRRWRRGRGHRGATRRRRPHHPGQGRGASVPAPATRHCRGLAAQSAAGRGPGGSSLERAGAHTPG
jgi:hypothetical protein